MKLVPYLYFAGNAEEAMNFYASALGGNVEIVSKYGDSQYHVSKIINKKLCMQGWCWPTTWL